MARLDLNVDVAVEGANNLKRAADDLGDLDKKAQSFSATLKKGAAAGLGFFGVQAIGDAVAKTAEFFSDAINAAAEFEDSVSATGVIFGQEVTPAMEEWADNAASAFGASKQLALESSNQMGVFAKSAGLAGDEAADFAMNMTQLGGDLASFFGGSTEEAITAIGAALRGESEPIRRYGVLLDDATLRQRAFEMGLVSTTKNALTPQVRVLAAQAEILEQTSDAQGDFGRTSEGMANTQREISAQLENLTIEIGQKLMPVLLDLAHFVRDVVIPAFDFLGEAIDGVANFVNPFTRIIEDMKQEGQERTKRQKQQLEATESHWEDMQTVYAAAAEGIAGEAEKIAEVPVEEIEARWDDVRAAALETTLQYQLGLLDGQNAVKEGMVILARLQEEEMTKTERIAYLKGQLASDRLAAGLRDNRPGVRSAALSLENEIVAELASLGVDAYRSGASVPANLRAGMLNNAHLVDGASSYLAAKISGYLPRSNAETGPLSNIMDVGPAIVHSITDGMLAEISAAEAASRQMASALALNPQTMSNLGPDVSSLPGGSGGLSGPSSGVTIVLNVDGDLPIDREKGLVDLIRRSTTVAGFGELDGVVT